MSGRCEREDAESNDEKAYIHVFKESVGVMKYGQRVRLKGGTRRGQVYSHGKQIEDFLLGHERQHLRLDLPLDVHPPQG